MPLQLFRNLLPNHNRLHFYFENPNDYLAMLQTRAVKMFTLNNYRINTNVIKVAIDSNLNEATADSITYAVDTRRDSNNNITYFRCYYVNKIEIQSGYAVLSCTIDLWASYFYKASSIELLVERSNKLLTKPIYDDIKAFNIQEYAGVVDSNGAVNGIATPDYMTYYQEIRRYYLVLVVNYNAKQSLDGSNSIATTGCMAIRLDDLRNEYIYDIDPDTTDPQEQAILNMSVIRLAQDWAGGVFGIASSAFSKNDARVVSAYIVRDFAVNNTGFTTLLDSISLLRSKQINANVIILNNSDYSEKVYIRNVDANKQFYFGKVHGGLKLNRIFDNNYMEVYVRFIINASSVQVIAFQGSNQEDITNAFELTITNNVSETTPLRHIAKSIALTLPSAKAYGSGGSAGAVMSGASTIANMLATSFSIDSKIRGDGDALMTFGGSGNYVNIPFKATYYLSLNNEEWNVRMYGATYPNTHYYSLNDLLDANYLITGNNIGHYVKGTIIINGLPKEATDAITSMFNGGIYLYDLRPSQ